MVESCNFLESWLVAGQLVQEINIRFIPIIPIKWQFIIFYFNNKCQTFPFKLSSHPYSVYMNSS